MRTIPYFIDIETVPIISNWEGVDMRTSVIFEKKFKHEIDAKIENQFEFLWAEKAALFAEFCKIVCVSIGIVTNGTLRIKAIAPEGADSEKRLLIELKRILDKAPSVCAHNGKEFDFPIIQRKMLIHGVDLPVCLDTMGKKPWEVLNEDTMELWSFGQYRHKISLDAIANCFGLESSKTDIDGSMIADIYYEECPTDVLPFDHMEKILKRIATYCNGDVVMLAQCWMKIRRMEAFKAEQIIFV